MDIHEKAMIASHITDLFKETIPEYDPNTPERFAEAWNFFTSGYRARPEEVLGAGFHDKFCGDGMVFQGSIPFFSLCEHHLLPFFGIVHFAYLPTKEDEHTLLVGLSKISRLIEVFGRRLQMQERFTAQITDAFMSAPIKPRGCGCVVRARHLCMEMRGVQKIGANTVTSSLRGLFLYDAEVRAEFMAFVRSADEGVKSI